MFEKVKALRLRYREAKNEIERQAIQKELDVLREQDPEAWGWAMVENAKETANEARELSQSIRLREQLEEILPFVSLSYIAKHYFDKSESWIYQRINGNIVNGKEASFNKKELETFTFALHDIGQKLTQVEVF